MCSLKAKQRDRIVLPTDLLNANHVAARVLSLWGPDGRRDAMSFVFDLDENDCVSSRTPYVESERSSDAELTLGLLHKL